MLPNPERTYHDPLHGAIVLDSRDAVEALLMRLIDTPACQRLRRIQQLGPASLTFHGAESSRFTHSLGVMALARRMFDHIAVSFPELRPYRAVVLCAALLHDVGHGPFSHTAEELFHCHHEHWTERIIQESPPIRQAMMEFDPELLPQVIQVYRKQHPVPFVWQLVTSQLDCDRLDYLMRDSYFTGASYGKIDLERIVMAVSYDPVSRRCIVARKGMAAIEHYLIVRYFMYAQVYNHPKNIAATWVLEHAFARARYLLPTGTLPVDETIAAWLLGDCDHLPLAQYLAADDGVFRYHVQRWQTHEDPVLADLCRRFVDRDLLKAVEISHLSQEQRITLLGQVRSHVQTLSLEATYYAGIRVSLSRGYTLYQQGIEIQTESGLEEINDLSPLIQTLAQPCQRIWLIYPRDVQHTLRDVLPQS